MLRMVIADDHALLRCGLARLFKTEFHIVAETADGESTARSVATWCPDVLLLDLYMPRCDPPVMIAQLRRDHPDLGIVVMTGTADHGRLTALLGVGASAIVLKGSGVDRLREAIARACRHRVYVDPDLQITEPPPGPALTPRESEVLELLACGNSYRAIGTLLHLGVRTIESYRRRIAD